MCSCRSSRDWSPAPPESVIVLGRGLQLSAPSKLVRDHCGHESDIQLDRLFQRTGTPRTDIRMEAIHAVRNAELVLYRLLFGQLPGVRVGLSVQQQDTPGVQHDNFVGAGHHLPAGGDRVWRPGPDSHPVRAGFVVCVHVPHDPRHNGQVGAAK